jgi:hypothetical protein
VVDLLSHAVIDRDPFVIGIASRQPLQVAFIGFWCSDHRSRRPRGEITVLVPPRLEGPSFPRAITIEETWCLPTEDLAPYVSAAKQLENLRIRVIASVNLGTKSRWVVGKENLRERFAAIG